MAKVAPIIDLAAQATWSVTLGESIASTKRANSLTSVRYNHSPKSIDRATVTQTIRPSRTKTGCEASIKFDDEQEWKYTGTHGNGLDSYVLLLNDNGGRKTATLERINTAVALNLSATPNESDAGKLQHKYQQLTLQPEDDHNHLESPIDGENTSPDPDNPFDYRHFLEDVQTLHDDRMPKSNASTPMLQPVSQTSPAVKKRKTAVEAAQPSTKRAKTVQQGASSRMKPNEREAPAQAKTTQLGATSRQKANNKPANVPSVRLERKATMPQIHKEDDDDDDSGELILENDEDTATVNPQSAMSLALNGQLGSHLGHGPISLHSAASSPASRIHSPVPDHPEFDKEDEFVLGDESEHDDNGDVEHLGLPSPIHDRNASNGLVEEDDDDEYDLEKQLEEAMGQDEEAPIVKAHEEEESEEE